MKGENNVNVVLNCIIIMFGIVSVVNVLVLEIRINLV